MDRSAIACVPFKLCWCLYWVRRRRQGSDYRDSVSDSVCCFQLPNPCPSKHDAKQERAIAMQTSSDANRLSDELSRVTQELSHARGELQHYHQRLTALHRLTDALACTSDEEEVIRVLIKGLPSLVDTVMIGFVRSNRNRVWIWSDLQNREREAYVHRYLLRRLGQFPSDSTGSRSFLRIVRARHLSLVPPSASQESLQEQDSTLGHEVSLVIGPKESGLLLVQPKDPAR